MDHNDDPAPASSRRRRLVYSREQFDDYWVALISRIRYNDEADKLVSGETRHPLVSFQTDNTPSLDQMRVLPFTLRQLVENPVQCYRRFIQAVDAALAVMNPIPHLGNLAVLEDSFSIHRRAQRFCVARLGRHREWSSCVVSLTPL